jgi:hypothetical protein
VAALHELHARLRGPCKRLREEAVDPRTGGIHKGARFDLRFAGVAHQRRPPQRAVAGGRYALCVRQYGGAGLGGGARVCYYQSRVVDPAIGIFIPSRVTRLEGPGIRGCCEVGAPGRRERLASREPVVKEETRADHPAGTKVACMRHHETHRPHDMRCRVEQHFALGEGFRDELELELLEVAQPAVDQLAARRARRGSEIPLLHKHRAEAPAGRVARNAHAVDAAADDEKICLRRAFLQGCLHKDKEADRPDLLRAAPSP